MDNGKTMGSVQLSLMRELAEARRGDDDWTGLRDQTERRKRQTRLALRAHRKRKAARKEAKPADAPESGLRLGENHAPETEYNICFGKQPVVPPASELFIPSYLSQSGHVVPVRYLYPISRDHLLPLLEYNVFRATTTNVLILGYLHLIGSSCRFGASVPFFPNPYEGDSIPDSLKPTSLQQSTLYPDWIDILPSPKMRDNAIRTQHQFTNSELCADLLPGLMGKQNDPDSGLVVWSDPWEPSGWELTAGFIRKWGFLVQGCTDLFQSTNRWRDLRGEEPLSEESK